MISIIVPVYNVESYLDRCIESLVNQTYRDIEIILIDDGSTDASGQICLRWQERDNRIIYIKKKNEGQGEARNLGVKISKGEHITFVDSDDWIEEDAIECMYKAAKKTNADIILCDINYILKNKEQKYISNISKLRIESDVIVHSKEDTTLIDKARVYLWGKLYSRKFYLNNNIEQPSHAFEDAVVVPFLIAKADTLYHIPKPLYNYDRSRMESTVNNIGCFSDLRKTLEELKERFEINGILKKYYETLRKISYAQIRFIYKKLLKNNREIEAKYVSIIDDLYDFMDIFYPEWINIDKYTVGVSGEVNLIRSVKNTVFNDYRIEQDNGEFSNLMNKDILFVDLVNDLFYNDRQLWKLRMKDNLGKLENDFKGKIIVAVKFIDKKEQDIEDIYNLYLNSCLNIKVIEFNGDRLIYDENLTWDLSDKFLKVLEGL